jgi:hypothetical protein
MTLVFLAGAAVGSSLTYAWLWWHCRAATDSFLDHVRQKARSWKPGDHIP